MPNKYEDISGQAVKKMLVHKNLLVATTLESFVESYYSDLSEESQAIIAQFSQELQERFAAIESSPGFKGKKNSLRDEYFEAIAGKPEMVFDRELGREVPTQKFINRLQYGEVEGLYEFFEKNPDIAKWIIDNVDRLEPVTENLEEFCAENPKLKIEFPHGDKITYGVAAMRTPQEVRQYSEEAEKESRLKHPEHYKSREEYVAEKKEVRQKEVQIRVEAARGERNSRKQANPEMMRAAHSYTAHKPRDNNSKIKNDDKNRIVVECQELVFFIGDNKRAQSVWEDKVGTPKKAKSRIYKSRKTIAAEKLGEINDALNNFNNIVQQLRSCSKEVLAVTDLKDKIQHLQRLLDEAGAAIEKIDVTCKSSLRSEDKEATQAVHTAKYDALDKIGRVSEKLGKIELKSIQGEAQEAEQNQEGSDPDILRIQ